MENTDSLMKCSNRKRGRKKKVVASPGQHKGMLEQTALHGDLARCISASDLKPLLTSLFFPSLGFFFPCVSPVLKYLDCIKTVLLGKSDKALVLKAFWQ